MRDEFVPANRLYDIESGTTIVHPAHQATDEDVREALEENEVRADGGLSWSEDVSSATIEGTRVPVVQIDRIDGDIVVSVDVATAVSEGFEFVDIWQCKRVTVSICGQEFAATITSCSIEHGIAAIGLTDCEPFGAAGDSR
ncbi:hypothetical protein [Natronobacterium gregoryi]|uniref:Uncharacterized protein n=2 Tax=Natronobacterium gregoryi TaxID=44930 RepID=L0AE34_NATGS|nr:hypothetical protein [Natronobacterium gregoryi]AFZ71412.1 hypothetical protein Natgr_0148 [Natronobacterium gregoryi SP2]ELY66937.1 hypothetical protein C490_11893 [Natronobacterium gregoryi SP2]PLK21208.1 hypothetical protein CYV19_05155 [Natronobacterium gregoryi SP2]SFI84375.1 hypothetical protein SAMN05443661_10721 [Natronobacterium gregoryi]